MGEADVSLKNWLKNKRRFADLFNGVVFGGRQVVKPEDLEEINSESDIIISHYGYDEEISEEITPPKPVQRYHDSIMRWHKEIDLAVLTVENQLDINYAMPVREMVYDGLAYADQLRNVWNGLRDEEKNGIDTAEFFSRFRKQDKIYPVISVVVYYGENAWDGAVELYDMFKIQDEEIKSILLEYVPNHRINLLDVSRIEDVTKFKSDLQFMFGVLKCRESKDAFIKYTNDNRDYFGHMDFESRQVLSALLNARHLFDAVMKEKGAEEDMMCKALQDIYQDGVSEGIECGIERGIERGITQGEQNKLRELIARKIKKNKSLEQIADELDEKVEDIAPIYEECMSKAI